MAITAESLKTGVEEAIKNFWCASLNATDPFEAPIYGFVRVAAYSNGPLTAAATEIGIVGIKELRKYAKRFACGEDISSLPDLDFGPGFTGGQCPSTLYNVSVRAEHQRPGEPTTRVQTGTFQAYGPISGYFWRVNPNNASQRQAVIEGRNAANTATIFTVTFTQLSSYTFISADITNISVSGGGPDTCGNPPESLPDGSDSLSGDSDVNGVDENGDPVTLTDEPFILFAPTINLNGDIVANINFPNLELCGQIVIGESVVFQPQSCGPKNAPTFPPDDEPKGDGDEEPDGDYDDTDPPDEVESGQTITATFIDSQALIPAVSQGQAPNGTGPTLLIPRIGAICWKVERQLETETLVGWTDPVDIRSVDAYFEAPKNVRVVAASVQWAANWQGTYRNVIEGYPPPCCGDAPSSPPPP